MLLFSFFFFPRLFLRHSASLPSLSPPFFPSKRRRLTSSLARALLRVSKLSLLLVLFSPSISLLGNRASLIARTGYILSRIVYPWRAIRGMIKDKDELSIVINCTTLMKINIYGVINDTSQDI